LRQPSLSPVNQHTNRVSRVAGRLGVMHLTAGGSAVATPCDAGASIGARLVWETGPAPAPLPPQPPSRLACVVWWSAASGGHGPLYAPRVAHVCHDLACNQHRLCGRRPCYHSNTATGRAVQTAPKGAYPMLSGRAVLLVVLVTILVLVAIGCLVGASIASRPNQRALRRALLTCGLVLLSLAVVVGARLALFK
jgi:hypothetical protein